MDDKLAHIYQCCDVLIVELYEIKERIAAYEKDIVVKLNEVNQKLDVLIEEEIEYIEIDNHLHS